MNYANRTLDLCLLLVAAAVSTAADRTVVTAARVDVDKDGILDIRRNGS